MIVFCFICGNPCHGMFPDSVEVFLEDIKYYDENKSKIKYKPAKQRAEKYKKMLANDPDTIKKISSLIKTTKWMKKCTMLTIDNKIVHNCEEVSCNATFEDNKNKIYYQLPYFQEPLDNFNGVFLHTDCWKFICNKYNFKLKFSDLPITYSKDYYKIFDFINYGDIEKYWGQDFKFIDTLLDKKEYLCSSPLLNDKNLSTIIKNFNKLKIRTGGDRKSPNVSATHFNNGIIKIGLDNNFWIIKNKKWVKNNEPIKTIKIAIAMTDINKNKFIQTLKFVGESSFNPVFIKSIDNVKKTLNIELLILESYINTFDEKIKKTSIKT